MKVNLFTLDRQDLLISMQEKLEHCVMNCQIIVITIYQRPIMSQLLYSYLLKNVYKKANAFIVETTEKSDEKENKQPAILWDIPFPEPF